MKYKGAISDADILINLAKADKIFILEHLFERIYIPKYVYERELIRKAGKSYSIIVQAFKKENSIFTLVDRKTNRTINYLAKDIIEEKKY